MEDRLNNQELEEASAGYGGGSNRRRVSGLQTGYLAMRTAPTYDYGNEIRGAELYNGDIVYICGAYVTGGDGRPYVWVTSQRNGVSGYVNANFLAW